MVLDDHPPLRRRHACRFPGKPFSTDDCPVQGSTQEDPSDPWPDFLLLVQSLRVAHILDIITESEEPEKRADELDRMSRLSISGDPTNDYGSKHEPRAASLVKSTGRAEYAGVFEPVLTRLRTHMRAELGNQCLTECREPAFTKHFPYLGIWKALESRNFQFKKMVLIRVEIDCVYASWTCLIEIVQYIVSGRGYAKNDIITADVEETMIDPGIFPGEGVDVLIVELGVLSESIVVIDASLVVLVEH